MPRIKLRNRTTPEPASASTGCDLLDDTYARLDNRGTRTLADISHATGIGFWWLRKFAARVFKDPGVRKVEALNKYLRRSRRRGG